MNTISVTRSEASLHLLSSFAPIPEERDTAIQAVAHSLLSRSLSRDDSDSDSVFSSDEDASSVHSNEAAAPSSPEERENAGSDGKTRSNVINPCHRAEPLPTDSTPLTPRASILKKPETPTVKKTVRVSFSPETKTS